MFLKISQHLQWLLLWFLQQNSTIFSVITITLGYNQNLSWKYCNYYHPYLYKNIHLLSKQRPASPKVLQSFPPKSKLHDPVKHLKFKYFNIFKGGGVSHRNTAYLIVSLCKIDSPIYQEEELTSV